jgi:hypothetical protein
MRDGEMERRREEVDVAVFGLFWSERGRDG